MQMQRDRKAAFGSQILRKTNPITNRNYQQFQTSQRRTLPSSEQTSVILQSGGSQISESSQGNRLPRQRQQQTTIINQHNENRAPETFSQQGRDDNFAARTPEHFDGEIRNGDRDEEDTG